MNREERYRLAWINARARAKSLDEECIYTSDILNRVDHRRLRYGLAWISARKRANRARADAWDEGYRAALESPGWRNPYRMPADVAKERTPHPGADA